VGGATEVGDNRMGCATATTSASTTAASDKGGGGISCSIYSKYIPKQSNMFYVMQLSLLLHYFENSFRFCYL
jgi:hypothetical protein